MSKKVKFKTIFDFCSKSKIKASEGLPNGDFPFYTSSQNLSKFINEANFRDTEALIFGTGGLASIHYANTSFSTSTDCFVTKLKNNDFFLKYIYYYLSGNIYILENGFKGAGLKHISKKYMEDIEIPFTSFEQQKQIAKTLDKANELMELRKESITKLDALAKSIFIDMFGDPVSNPKDWEIKKLRELTSKIGSGSTPRGGKDSYKEEGISLIRSLNIHDNRFKYKDLALIDDLQAKSLANVIVEENDVLLNITGASVCRCAIVPTNVLPARVNQHVAIIRTIENLNPNFLLHLFISSYKLKLLNLASSGGATREALTKENLELLEIIVPPLELQNKFAKVIEKIEEQKTLYTQELEKLQINFDALLQKSFQE